MWCGSWKQEGHWTDETGEESRGLITQGSLNHAVNFRKTADHGFYLQWTQGLVEKKSSKTIIKNREIVWKCSSLSGVQIFANPWTVAHQVLQSMGFFRQEYWSGLPFPSPGELPDPGIEPKSPTLQEDYFTIWVTREAYLKRGKCYTKDMLTVIWHPGKRSILIIAEWMREGFFKAVNVWVATESLEAFPANKGKWKKEKGNSKGKDMWLGTIHMDGIRVHALLRAWMFSFGWCQVFKDLWVDWHN